MMWGFQFAMAVLVGGLPSLAAPDWVVVRKGESIRLECPTEKIRRVPGGPVSGPAAEGEWFPVENTESHLLVQRWDPDLATSNFPPKLTVEASFRGWVPMACASEPVRVVRVRTTPDWRAIVSARTMVVFWDAAEPDAMTQLSLFKQALSLDDRPSIHFVDTSLDSARADQALAEGQADWPVWRQTGSESIQNEGVWAIGDADQGRKVSDEWQALTDRGVHRSVMNDGNPFQMDLDDFASLEGSLTDGYLRNDVSDLCLKAALGHVDPASRQYVRYAAEKVRSGQHSEIAFWDLTVFGNKRAVTGSVVGRCALEAFAPFVALRVTESGFVPTHPIIGGGSSLEDALVELGQFAKERRLRGLWLIQGEDAPSFPVNAGPTVQRTMKLKVGFCARRKVERIMGPIFHDKGAILVLY